MALYLDLAERLMQAAADGPTDRLPIQDEIAQTHGVSLATVHRAIASLKATGRVYTTHAGTYIGPRPQPRQ